ncbi:MAG: DUF1080 domain-containing protein [Opitutaceae bacterium]|nr:DUF1080 domain-containing protein [Opitutaceae bacterium]
MKRILSILILSAFALSRTFAAEANTLTAAEKSAGWKLLFDGKSLDGWKPSENKGTFTVQDGLLVAFGKRSHLFYEGPVANHDFKNFELQLDIKTFPKANGGVYFHTQYQETGWPEKGYEVQVNNTHSDKKKGAGLYSIQDNFEAPAKDGEWYTMRIKVEGKHVQTFVNGRKIVDYTEEPNAERPPNMKGRLISHGTLAIQGHDPESKVMYKNIKVRVLP